MEEFSNEVSESTIVTLAEKLDKLKKELHQYPEDSEKRAELEKSFTDIRESLLRIIPNLEDYNKMVSMKRRIKGLIGSIRYSVSYIKQLLFDEAPPIR